MIDKNIMVLGAGAAGIAAADRLKEAGVLATIYEQETTYGGLLWSTLILQPRR